MEQNRTKIAKEQMLKALEGSLGIVTTALKSCDLSRTNYYKWLKEDAEFAQAVNDVELIAKDFPLPLPPVMIKYLALESNRGLYFLLSISVNECN